MNSNNNFLKKHLIISIFITSFLISGCSNIDNEMNIKLHLCCDTLNNDEIIDSTIVSIYNIDSSFYKFFDSIIEEEKHCPYYNGCNSGFLFTTSPLKSTSGFEEMMISSLNTNRYDYSKCIGLIKYNNHRFVLDSMSNIKHLQKTSLTVQVKYIKEKKRKKKLDIDDRHSNWFFYMKEDHVICAGHHQCLKPD